MMIIMAELWRDAMTAIAALTVLGAHLRPVQRPRLARATLFFPLVGGLIGAGLVALGPLGAESVSQPLRSVLWVGGLAALSRGWSLRAVARAARYRLGVGGGTPASRSAASSATAAATVVGLLILKILALASVPEVLEPYALILAPVLAHWAPVVLAYGARPIVGAPEDTLLVGRVTFREFGWASVAAFGIALSVAEAVGLVAVITAALIATGLRTYVYARAGCMRADMLGVAVEVIELTVFALVALVAGTGAPRAGARG